MSNEKRLYSNYKMLAPDGQLLCRIGEKRFKWYLNRKLATVSKDDNEAIVLNFEPAGRGHQNNPYGLAHKKNICVICGDENQDELTKHHIVPYCFRKHFPVRYKEHQDHDVLLVCQKCHNAYEKYAAKIKKEYEILHIKSIIGKKQYNIIKASKINRQACGLLKNWDNIPPKRIKEIKKNISKFLRKKKITKKDIIKVSKMNVDGARKKWAEYTIKQCKSIESFIEMWRKHFIDTMHPKFLPDFWEDCKDDYKI